MPIDFDQKGAGQRLTSWKEIAAFFTREERTVKRWEKERGLPVHRVPGGGRASVYAFTEELRAWLNSGEPRQVEAGEDSAEESREILEVLVGRQEDASREAEQESALAAANVKSWLATAGIATVLTLGGAFTFSHYFQLLRIPGRTWPVIVARTHGSSHQAAVELYLQGRYHWNKRTPSDLTLALDDFTEATEIDPDYALAYAGKADCYNLLREYAGMPPSQAFPLAISAANKAIELDDSLSEGHRALGFAEFYWNWDVTRSEHEFKRAIALDPQDVESHHWYATALLAQARYPESIAEIERARQIDPASSSIAADRAQILFASGRKDEAVTLLLALQDADPGFYSPPAYLARIYYNQKQYDKYFAEAEVAAKLAQNERAFAETEAARKHFAAGGEQEMFQGILEERLQNFQNGRSDAISVAAAYAELGKNGEAMQYLEKAYQRHEYSLITLSDSPEFKVLSNTSEFHRLMARVHSYASGHD